MKDGANKEDLPSRADTKKRFNAEMFKEWKKQLRNMISDVLKGYNSPVKGRTYGVFLKEQINKDDMVSNEGEIKTLDWENAVKTADTVAAELKELSDKKVVAWRLSTTTDTAWTETLSSVFDKMDDCSQAFDEVRSLVEVVREIKLGMKSSTQTQKRH